MGSVLGLLVFAAAIVAGAAYYVVTLPPVDMSAANARSPVVLDRNGQLLRPFITPDGRWRLPVDAKDVDEHYLKLLFAYEDQRFFSHHGVDPLALLRAAGQLLTHGRIVSGGSTLTMQVARLIEPRSERSLGAKLRQMARAIDLERHYSKTEILNMYLALAPFGGNIEGVRAASLAYFGREPKHLSLGEAALLVTLPQSPEGRRPDRFANIAKTTRDRVLKHAMAVSLFPHEDLRQAVQEPVPVERKIFPAVAPQVADAIVAQTPNEPVHRLTLDFAPQTSLEKLAQERAQALGPNISVAMVLVDNASGEILASVGGADYFSKDRAGSIDLTKAIRSPGSALKPFIYGLSFEQGIAHPETILEDRPSRFGLYAPENFDRTFQGTVTARQALQMSLNIPAIDVLSHVGPDNFLARLRLAGATVELPKDSVPGLSVAIGGLGISLQDVARLYVGLARGGNEIPLTMRLNDPTERTPRPFLDPVATWYVTDILRGAPPPTNAQGGYLSYKTGTSYGYRDAWAIGYDRKHTLAVWVGRADGAAVSGLAGRVSAAPILFDGFARVGVDYAPFPQPKNALIATNAQLPPPLRRLHNEVSRNTPVMANTGLKIAFPPDGARLDLASSGEAFDQLVLKAEGGVVPLTWLIDGKPLQIADLRREASFTPEGRGFTTIMVMDATGATDSVTIRMQ
ncbi:penicillin-binding protein 1C [Methylovirgula sp. 4M-Z18]|uniref:penicillin-binding protein 1C n=1 Tax=Methylovirgula sp. 4M-Z18 TaxID=2293567 RepID=UPI001FE0B393|nr:penicillin-binding protein 1C [Methylovirgula sp. 4M-Z18]